MELNLNSGRTYWEQSWGGVGWGKSIPGEGGTRTGAWGVL